MVLTVALLAFYCRSFVLTRNVLVGYLGSGIEHAVNQTQDGASRRTIIGGRAHYQAVTGVHLVDDLVTDVVTEDAMAVALLGAGAASDAASHGLGANPHDFGLDALFIQGFGGLAQCQERVYC